MNMPKTISPIYAGSPGAPTAGKPDSLRDIILRIQDHVISLNTIASRVVTLNARLTGGIHAAESDPTPPPPDVPMFAAANCERLLREYAEAMSKHLTDLETNLI